MPDFANLPLILCGPIVRRVEPTTVSVWVALSAACTVELGVWVGPTSAPAGFFGNGSAAHTAAAPTRRLGAKLHLALVTLELGPAPLVPGQIYAYNIAFFGAGDADLSSLLLLQNEGPPDEPVRLALGYVPGMLPTFALPPPAFERLQIGHGSCRKPHGHGPDGLAVLDKMIERTRDDPLARPHQLFLTGDQVYADDVAMGLLPQLTVAGNELLGATESVPLKTSTGTTSVEVTPANFKATWRQELTTQQARMTSGDASSHIISFGEACALYLFAWSNVLWQEPTAKEALFSEGGDADKIVAGLPEHLRDLYPPASRKEKIAQRAGLKDKYAQQKSDLTEFRKTLPNVQRALANVPTYMIFDDHEVTDDWYLTLDWRDKVLTAPLGVTIMRNTLLAFTLFQAWGNTPQRYSAGDHAALLALVPQLFGGGASFPNPAAANQIDALFGFDGSVPAVRWDFIVPTGPTQTIVLDTRTRRGYVGRFNPPGLLSAAALEEQFPATLAPSPGAELVLVVSPAPVLGLALIEELAQPLAARGKADFYQSVVKEGEPAITGAIEFDFEAWALDAPRFEAFLARCAQMKKVVILSGDVHYANTCEMDYWRQGQPEPSRIVQLTASALKNDAGVGAKRALETVVVQELAHSAFYPVARLGWDDPLDLLGNVAVPGDAIPRQLRALLRRTPTVIPTEGWPAGTAFAVAPEWSWRMSLLEDTRPDDASADARPADGQVGAITPELDVNAPEAGYVAVLQRAEKQLKSKIARAVIFASNLGLVTFGGTPIGVPPNVTIARTLRHSLMYDHPAGKKPADPQAYSAHDVGLSPTADAPPSIALT